MTESDTDITGDIGELFVSTIRPKYPMYSFSRAASLFWQGYYNGLRKNKLTHKQAIEYMQSKAVRWLLDSDNSLLELGERLAGSVTAEMARKGK